MYEAQTFDEMYEDFQRDAVPHIVAILRESIPKISRGPWIPNPSKPGEWAPERFKTRDRIRFAPDMPIIQDNKIIGTAVPSGEQKNIQAVLLERSRPLGEGGVLLPLTSALAATQAYVEKTYEVGESTEHVETRGSVFGWDFSNTIESNTTVGNDSTPAKQEFKVSVTWGVHGEKSERTSDTVGAHTLNSTTDHVPLPLGYLTNLTQTQKTGQIEIPVEHQLVMGLKFQVYGWKDRAYEGRFRNGPDHKKEGSKSRRVWKVNSEDDFRITLAGRNRRYPDIPEYYRDWRKIEKHYNYLMSHANRTAVVRVTDHYKRGFFDAGVINHTPI